MRSFRAALVGAALLVNCGIAAASSCGSLPEQGLAAVSTIGANAEVAAGAGQSRGRAATSLIDQLPLAFSRPCGARESAAEFHARGRGYLVKLTPDAAVLALQRPTSGAKSASPAFDLVRLRFVGANPAAPVRGLEPLPGTTNHFRAGQSCTGIASFGQVRISDAYPGIDLLYYGNGQELEFDLVIGAGADPDQIRLAVDGADRLAVDAAGNLDVRIGSETLTLRRPVAYQDRHGRRWHVDTSFVHGGGNEVMLKVSAYDSTEALTIDPVLSYATWLGGTRNDYGTAVAVDASGNVFVAGYTTSADFPTLNSYDKTLGTGDTDAFVTKLASTGKALVYSTLLGGAGVDRAVGIAIDAAGNAYVTGTTTGSFPTTAGAYQATAAGAGSFVAKLGPSGNTLLYSTYVQGVEARGIAVNAAGNAHVAGRVVTTFATTPGAYRQAQAGAFALKLNAAGTAASYATYLGGGGEEAANSIALDAQGNLYIAGSTSSSAFPTVNAWQPARNGGSDGFLAKLDAAGSALLYSTYLGGALDDSINAVAVDTAGNAYVAGETYSADFPVHNAFMARKPGALLADSALGSAFYAKIGATGDTLLYASFLGGEICTGPCNLSNPPAQTPGDAAYGIAIDSFGHAYVTGLARSFTFPLLNSLKPAKTLAAQDAAFVTRIGRTGGYLLYSTLTRVGAAEPANTFTRFPAGAATGVAVDGAGAAFVTGDADSAGNFTTSSGAFQTTNGGAQGAIVLKLAPTTGTLTLTASATNVNSPTPVTLTAAVSGVTLTGSIAFRSGPYAVGTATISGSKARLTTVLPVGIHALTAVHAVSGKEMDSNVLNVVVDNGAVCN